MTQMEQYMIDRFHLRLNDIFFENFAFLGNLGITTCILVNSSNTKVFYVLLVLYILIN